MTLQRLETLFDRQVERSPNAVAIIHRGEQLSYQALRARADALASRLRGLSVGPEVLVAIAIDRSFDLITAVLAVLKSGGAFVPIDFAYPIERLNYILSDCAALHLITAGPLPDGLIFGGKVVDLRDDEPIGADDGPTINARVRSSDDAAYVIYTSGTTGTPKGVILTHTASLYVEWALGQFTDGELDEVAFVTSICFDPSIFEIFAPLAVGGRVLIKENALEPFSANERPTLLQGVPSVVSQLVDIGAIPSSVRVINLGGEVLTRDLARKIYDTTAVERLYNHYGPTEATTCASVALVKRDEAGSPSLGTPICGAELHLCGEDLTPVANGTIGEIVIEGPTVARGYLKRPDLTARSFFEADGTHSRMYRTGDLARRNADGSLQFVGRNGDQVKFHGFRVELEEIESAATRLPSIQRAAAAVLPDANGRERLALFYVGSDGLDHAEARQRLAQILPPALIPSHWVRLSSLPLGLTGKLDRAALPPLPTTKIDDDGSTLETLIRGLCADALGQPGLGIDDDLYAQGDSLAIIQISLLLEERLGIAIGTAMISHLTTVSAIAATVRERSVRQNEHLLPMSQTGTGPTIFCVPELYGWPTCFVNLARQPNLDSPVYGLVPGALSNDIIRSPNLGRLVRSYADSIERAHPYGRCIIAGYSFGGMWAHALACELERRGRDATLVLIDAPLNGNTRSALRFERSILSALGRARREHRPLGQLYGLVITLYATASWRRVVARLRFSRLSRLAGASSFERDTLAWVPTSDLDLSRAFAKAASRHQPHRFGGPCVVIPARNDDDAAVALFDHDGWLGWREFLTGTAVRIDTDVDHAQMIRPPFVSRLAQLINHALASLPV